MPSRHPKVVILLATRNGAEFLREQLESFRAQTYANWELIVSDDGSTDATATIVGAFAASVTQRVVLRPGPQKGFWQNFVSLVRDGDSDGDLFAYSDQDDIWLPEKLDMAVAWFDAQSEGRPLLYFTRTELIDRDGAPLGFSPLFTRPPVFENAMVQNIGGGNTMVFNRAARLALQTTPVDAELVSHDWWTYQMITGIGGVAHYDPRPSLKYRQHGQNIVGSNIGLRARLVRLRAFANGRVVSWNTTNLAFLARIGSLLTPTNAVVLERFARARHASLPVRLYLIWRSGVYRQSAIENIGLFVGALFGRL
ncbi:glycosyltransferase family 2 protein [Rhodopseudomonas sp. RCAM05734]|uniref:glycosyltransferase family 2 protein n=1 Tax=Rhodopseudomonas sp. RCAM05734 TaxID=3457549 RepID=UPI0040441B00